MRTYLTRVLGAAALLALAAPVLAQQGGGQAPPPGAGAPRPGGGPGGPGGPPPGGGGGRQGGGGGFGGGPPPAPNTAIPLSAHLWGGLASGDVTVLVDPPKGQMCYLFYGPIDTASAAHIHAGTAAAPGATVATLKAPVYGSSGDCQPMAAAQAQALANNPGGYVVDVHTASNGLVAGTLTR